MAYLPRKESRIKKSGLYVAYSSVLNAIVNGSTTDEGLLVADGLVQDIQSFPVAYNELPLQQIYGFYGLDHVTRSEAEELARSLNIPYVECSAKLRMNVDQAFHGVVRLVRRVDGQPGLASIMAAYRFSLGELAFKTPRFLGDVLST
ncbi:hypothetical protein COOONC_15524, partial [Cooperia oncophora]